MTDLFASTLTSLPPIFQNWSPGTETEDTQVAFSTTAEAPAEFAHWRLDLSADPRQAAVQLSHAEAQMDATRAALDEIPTRIERLAQDMTDPVDQTTSFSAGAVIPEVHPAEQDLLNWVESLTPDQVSFGLETMPKEAIRAASKQLEQTMNDLINLITKFAWIETRLEGHFLARTAVGWTGDMETTWNPEILTDQYQLHRRSLKLGLTSRITILRIFMIVTQGAGKISALIAMPGGALLALPAVWKYTSQILAEVHNYQTVIQA